MAKGFEEFESIFGKANVYGESSSLNGSYSPFLFHVHALDASRIRIHVTDFHSYTWEAVRSIQQLEDLRDDIGIGGSWSEFLDYFISSMKSDTVKLVMGQKGSTKMADGHSGETFTRFIAHKSKGMPLLSISLERLMDSSANDAMSNLSLELFKAFKSSCNVTIEGEKSFHQLTNSLSAEQEKNESVQNKLDVSPLPKKQKLQKFDVSDKTLHTVNPLSTLDAMPVSATDGSLEKQSTQNTPTKVGHRAAPAYRRAKVRGVILEDTEGSN